MKKLNFSVLSSTEIEKRYGRLKNTKIAELTNKALKEDYQIGVLSYEDLWLDHSCDWSKYAKTIVDKTFRGQKNIIGIITDVSESYKNKIYFAFKTKKD